jgi:hypothetical protein
MKNSASTIGMVSLGAAAAVLPAGAALAQDMNAGMDGMTLTIEGGAADAEYMENMFEGKGGAGYLPNNKGFYGSVAISKAINDTWDWRLSASTLSLKPARTGVNSSYFETDLDGTIATADAGRNYTLGKTKLRLGVGIMAARYSDSSELYLDPADTMGKGVQFDNEATYRGFGPRLSADVSHPVSKDGRLSLIGGASVGKTFGSFDTGFSVFVQDPPDPDLSIDKYGDLDGSALIKSAYLGMSYQHSDRLSLSAGIRQDRFDGDLDGSGGFDVGIAGSTATTNTVFAGMSIQF